MSGDRKAVVMRIALEGVANATPESVPAKHALRSVCSLMVMWVLLGDDSNRPPAAQRTDFVCRTAGEAIEAAFTQAYGADRSEISSHVIARLASIGF